jgi:DNA transposition AAA+ family ATPase
MKQPFIETSNVHKFAEICNELISPASLVGPSLAMITGPAGRGKSEAAKHFAIHNGAIYIPPMITRTPAMLLREISFELAGTRPSRTDGCLDVIGEEMSKKRQLIMIDEADLLEMRCLELLRNVNESFACPILLIGEESLKGKIGARRRLFSRIRRRLEFGPINQHDISYYLRAVLDVKTTPDVLSIIHRYANGDWRPVLTMIIGIERSMKASGIKEITTEMVKDVLKNS